MYINPDDLCKKVGSLLWAAYCIEIHEGVEIFVEDRSVAADGQSINAFRRNQFMDSFHTVVEAVAVDFQKGGCRGGMETAVKPGTEGFIVVSLLPAVVFQKNAQLRNKIGFVQRVSCSSDKR